MGWSEASGEMAEGSRKDAGLRFWSHREMRDEIMWAMEALDRHVRDGRSPFATDGPWAQVIRSSDVVKQTLDDLATDAEPPTDRQVRRTTQLRTRDVERMNTVLHWIEAALPADPDPVPLRQLVGVVGMLASRDGPHISWTVVRGRLHLAYSNDAVRMAHSRAITRICRYANARRVPATC